MSLPPYGPWSPADIKSEQEQFSGPNQPSPGSNRRGGNVDQQSATFTYPGNYPQNDPHRPMVSRSIRTQSTGSTSSSLSGAMGDTHITSQNRPSNTPPSGMAWTPSPTSTLSEGGYMDPGFLAPPTPLTAASPSGAFPSFSQYDMPLYTTGSPETISPHSSGMPSPIYPDPFPFQHTMQGTCAMPSHNLTQSTPMVISPAATPAPTLVGRPARPSRDRMEDEIRRLNQRVRELELELISKELKDEVSRGGFPSPLPTPTPAPPSAFQENWQARTDARVKLLCSLNRAGNALCAWHDSRRERRAYPPRMAPPGYLNCGCTFDEALFEESLARHGVGSYLPGESVRMDPALRNPLLKLLQQRYHYRDGDFERDPVTGNWIEGEGASFWEGKVTAGVSYSRKYRGEERRS